jgi:hypothetical protein
MSVLWNPNHPKYYNKLHKHLPTRSSEQLVDHSAQPLRRNARRIVRTYTSGRAEHRAVMLRQIAQVWTRPKSHLKILGAKVVTRNKFNMEDPKILGATVKKFIHHEDLAPGICVPVVEISLLKTNTSAKLPIAHLRNG